MAHSTQNDIVLSIDVGTQSVRVVLFDLAGNIVQIEKTIIEPYFSPQPGFAEQNPIYYWEKLKETTRKLFDNLKVDISRIAGMAMTTQRGTIINLDANGNPLRPAIVWLDQRRTEKGRYPNGVVKQGMKVLGLYDGVVHAMRDAEVNWLRKNQPDIWEKTKKYVFLSSYLIFKLTGNFVDSVGSTVGYIPFDYKRHRWSKAGSRNAKMFPVEREKLVDLVKPSETLGYISAIAANETGIPAGMPLIASAADKACEVLGSGCMTPEIACLSYGTTATVQTTSKKYVEIIPFFPPYPSAISGMFNTEAMIYRGFWMISWFKNEFGHREIEITKDTDKEPEDLFDEMIRDIPPGSLGLTLQPYWSPGVKIPGTEAKGAIIGFGDVHTRAHIYRSILEGLAYALRDGLIRTQRRTGVRVKKIRVSGGGSQSKNVMQLTADIFGLPSEKPHTYETSALGAAINAAVGLGLYPDYETAISNMCRIGEVYLPNHDNYLIYNKLFRKVYQKMYPKLKPLYDQIKSITHYPS